MAACKKPETCYGTTCSKTINKTNDKTVNRKAETYYKAGNNTTIDEAGYPSNDETCYHSTIKEAFNKTGYHTTG